jgi:hypothetical protein
MRSPVELQSTTDPIYVRPRSVWYWAEIDGVLRSPRSNDYATVYGWAVALCQEHGTYLVDNSHAGTGFLGSALRHEND